VDEFRGCCPGVLLHEFYEPFLTAEHFATVLTD
jgi:hypothetical protein